MAGSVSICSQLGPASVLMFAKHQSLAGFYWLCCLKELLIAFLLTDNKLCFWRSGFLKEKLAFKLQVVLSVKDV